MQEKNYSQQVTDRLMEVTGITSIKKLVVFLDVNEGTFRSWLSRDSLDTRLVIAKCNKENLNYILAGKREVNEGGNKGEKEGAFSHTYDETGASTEVFPADGGSGCKNCQILETKYFEARDYLLAKEKEVKELNQEVGALKYENEELRAENAQLRSKLGLENKQQRSA